MTYYNTNKESGNTLAASQAQAGRQEDRILAVFAGLAPGQRLTPFEVKDILRVKWPITSIRRAITNLTSDGELVKHDRMRMGDYGKDNHTWGTP